MLLGTVFMFFGPHVGKLSAVDSGSARSPENALLETQLDGIIDQLREVKVNLSQVNVQTGVNRVDGLFYRVEQLKRRSALLVERAVRISELCKRDLR